MTQEARERTPRESDADVRPAAVPSCKARQMSRPPPVAPPTAGPWELMSLVRVFAGDDLRLEDMSTLGHEEVPEPYKSLLCHERHMTVTLEAFHGRPVHLVVQDRKWVGDVYCRKLHLTAGPGGRVTLAGVVKFHMGRCAKEIRDLVLQETVPLGRILMAHCALRRIEPHAFVRVRLSAGLRNLFAVGDELPCTYGRVATITCGHTPSVELLEIVSPEEPRPEDGERSP